MYLVYEQYDLTVAVHHFLHYPLKPFLELSLILGTRYKRTQIKRIDLL